jgi:aryl-alcohol dehydrogenase-like predicted oxidoreductase
MFGKVLVMSESPATTSLTHLKEILDAAAIDLTAEEVHAITQLVPEDTEAPKET